MRDQVALGLMALVLCAYASCVLQTSACTPAERQTAMRVITMTASVCEAVARAQGRDDVAAICHATESGSAVLDQAMAAQSCEMPRDAGGE